MRRWAILVVVLLAVSTVATLGTSTATAQGENKAQAGELAPFFSVDTLKNRTVTLSDYQGKVLVLEFFASWCPHCKDQTSELRMVRENFSSENVGLLSIESSPGVPIENVRNFKSEYGGDWPFAKAPSVASDYGVEGYPTVFIVSPDGYIDFRSSGAVPANVLNSIVADILKPTAPSENRPENRPENQAEITNVIIDVGISPENAGGIVGTSLEIKKNGAPLFTYRVKSNPGYEFENWSGKAVPENQRSSRTLKIVPGPGTKVTANFAPLENEQAGNMPGGETPSGPFGAFGLASFALGAVVAGCLGVLGGYLAWGRKRTGSEES